MSGAFVLALDFSTVLDDKCCEWNEVQTRVSRLVINTIFKAYHF